MLESSSFAILAMTGEIASRSGKKLPRLNVVHEAGLFQGKLGFSRAIILLEKRVKVFSNLDGVQIIPFKKGCIETTFGDVLATIKREFKDVYAE